MASQIEKAESFRRMHVPGDPVVLYNIWDAGSAMVVAEAGARAIATGSWSVAAAQGYKDGEEIPLDGMLGIVARIAQCVDLPLTVDFEGGYAVEPEAVGANVARLLALGAIGLNFEDQVVGGPGLHPIEDQVARLRAVRAAADALGVPAVINARTDLFLKAPDGTDHAALIAEALARASAYAEAGADSFFVPALTDPGLIRRVCEASPLPVNVMMMDPLASVAEAAALGVARVSFGPGPYRMAMKDLDARFRAIA